jgi:hypothetical protein
MLKFLKRLFSAKLRRLGSSQTSCSPSPGLPTTPDPHVSNACQTNSLSHGGHHASAHSVDCSSDGGGHIG